MANLGTHIESILVNYFEIIFKDKELIHFVVVNLCPDKNYLQVRDIIISEFFLW